MGFESFLAGVGLGGLVAEDFFFAQVVLMSVTALLFLASLVISLMAFRAAAAARQARREANDLAAEMRHLTAQVELAVKRPAARPVEAAMAPCADEADENERMDVANDAVAEEPPPADRTLDAAREAATVPKALVGSLLRRRR